MERWEAEAVYEQGREVVVAALLRMDAPIQALSERVAKQEERIAQLERRLRRNSRNFPAAQPGPARVAATAWQASLGSQAGRPARP